MFVGVRVLRAEMELQYSRSLEEFVTLRARQSHRRLVYHFDVLSDVAIAFESLVAMRAFNGSLLAMRHHVPAKEMRGAEGCLTEIACMQCTSVLNMLPELRTVVGCLGNGLLSRLFIVPL